MASVAENRNFLKMGASQIILKVGQPKTISAQIFKQKICM
jgi:hypothetical protein